MEQDYNIPVLSETDPPLPEGTSAKSPTYTLAASLVSLAETIARGRKYNPTSAKFEIYDDLRRMVAVAKARKIMSAEDMAETDWQDLALFLMRDAGFQVPVDAIDTLKQLSMEAVTAFWSLVEFMQPFVTEKQRM